MRIPPETLSCGAQEWELREELRPSLERASLDSYGIPRGLCLSLALLFSYSQLLFIIVIIPIPLPRFSFINREETPQSSRNERESRSSESHRIYVKQIGARRSAMIPLWHQVLPEYCLIALPPTLTPSVLLSGGFTVLHSHLKLRK